MTDNINSTERKGPKHAGEATNPRFIAYALQTGAKDAADALARDRTRYPGGVMCGFMLWLGERWDEFFKLKGWQRGGNLEHLLTNEDHADFDAWLKARRP